MSNTLPKQSFVALAALGWVDGTLSRSEAAGLVEAAKKHGISGEDLASVELCTKSMVSLDVFEPGEMSEWDRVLTYALGTWLSRIDGVQSRSETEALVKLGERLGLTEAVRARASAAAFDVSVLPDGNRPDRFDFDLLVVKLKERLPRLAK